MYLSERSLCSHHRFPLAIQAQEANAEGSAAKRAKPAPVIDGVGEDVLKHVKGLYDRGEVCRRPRALVIQATALSSYYVDIVFLRSRLVLHT